MKVFLLLISLSLYSLLFADISGLRITCDEGDEGAKIYINNKLKGECPLDTTVKSGNIAISVNKIVDDEYEKVFSKRLRVFSGEVKRIEVEFSKPQLTAQAIKNRKAEKLRQEALILQKEISSANNGDIASIKSLINRYQNGDGVEKSINKVNVWSTKLQKAEIKKAISEAHKGDVQSMEYLITYYTFHKNTKEADKWRTKLVERVNQEEYEKEQRRAEEREENKNLIIAKIDKISYTENIDLIGGKMKISPIVITISPFITVTMIPSTFLDILSYPTKWSKKRDLEKQLAAHASLWGNKNSMIAKAYQQKYRNELLVSR